MTDAALDDGQLALLSQVLDRIVPAHGDFPGAGGLVVAGYIEGVVGESAESRRLFADGLSQIESGCQTRHGVGFTKLPDDQRDEVLRQVETNAPRFFSELVQHTYSGYYTRPEIIELIGLEPRPPQPLGYRLEPGDLSLLENVRKRGKVYREV